MQDTSDEASPTSITGGLVGTSAGLLLVDTMVLGRERLNLRNTLRAPRWAPIVLRGPSCTSQVWLAVSMLGCRMNLLASRDSGHGAGEPAKDTWMPKSVLVMLVVSENI